MRQEIYEDIGLEALILLGFLVSFNPINLVFMILPFFRKFRHVFFGCENVSRVVRHFYFIELAFLSD